MIEILKTATIAIAIVAIAPAAGIVLSILAATLLVALPVYGLLSAFGLFPDTAKKV